MLKPARHLRNRAARRRGNIRVDRQTRDGDRKTRSAVRWWRRAVIIERPADQNRRGNCRVRAVSA